MMKVSISVEEGNRFVVEGILPTTVLGLGEAAKPEACYFTVDEGKRAGFFFFLPANPPGRSGEDLRTCSL
jgi:hypothetical protein